jgi:hypothetical protein
MNGLWSGRHNAVPEGGPAICRGLAQRGDARPIALEIHLGDLDSRVRKPASRD